MNGDEKQVLLELVAKVGQLTEAATNVKLTNEELKMQIQRIDQRMQDWQRWYTDQCQKFRRECSAFKEISSLKEAIRELLDRVKKLEVRDIIQRMTWKALAKIIGTIITIVSGIAAALKALGILK